MFIFIFQGLSKELSPAGRHVRQTGADSDPFAVTNMQAESSVDCPTTGQMVSLVNDKTRSDGKPLPDLIKCFGHFMELSSTELCKDKFSQVGGLRTEQPHQFFMSN